MFAVYSCRCLFVNAGYGAAVVKLDCTPDLVERERFA